MRKIGNWVFVYGIFVGIVGFIVGFGVGIGMGYTYAAANTFVKIVIGIFCYLIGAGWIFGSALLIIGGAGLIYKKDWGKRISIIGIWFGSVLACGTIGSGFIFAMPPPRWSFDNGDFIFFAITGGIILSLAIVILKKLKKI